MENEMIMKWEETIRGNLGEVDKVRAALAAMPANELSDKLQDFIQNREEYCDELNGQINRLDATMEKMIEPLDCTFEELGGPAAAALGQFKKDMVEILEELRTVTEPEDFRRIGNKSCDAQTDMYNSFLSLIA